MKFDRLLWTVQWLLAVLFLLAGGMKLVLPVEPMIETSGLPGPLLRFVGVAEVAGALGLVMPGLLRVRPVLTPLAACGLVLVMIGAVVLSARISGLAFALFPAIVGLLSGSVAYGRWRVAHL